ncbi:MAG: hypothetical protein M3680_20330 [Myxococcota bacterium]|nr:hypothetical protein [Myxococcota bacterium]
MKSWLPAVLVVMLVLFAGCGEAVSAHVNCVTTAAPAVECDVQQTKGTSEIEVCWDFAITCANGAVVKAANTCQKVKDGGTTKVTIPADRLDGVDKCGGDQPPTGTLANLTINGKPSTK